MKKFAILAIAALVSVSAFAGADGIGNSYIKINDTWYTGSGPSSGQAGIPEYAQGASAFGNLGTIYSLTLGASFQAWDGATPDWQGGEEAWMHYTIDGDDSAWKDVTMTYAGYGYGEYQNNMIFENKAPEVIDVSSFVDDGKDHTISIYFGSVDGHYDQPAAGVNYVGTFKVASTPVPEPATMSLLGLGALAMVLRRKLRK